jgi:YjjI family glycine radical enzyme
MSIVRYNWIKQEEIMDHKKLPEPFMEFENLEQGLTPSLVDLFQQHVSGLLHAPNLIYEQKRDALAATAVASLPYPPLSKSARQLIETGVICLLGEGAAPYHPRYVAPDYARLLKNGSAFLELAPARDLFEATASLLTAYKYIPCGGLPVFIGRVDELLEPYFDSVPPDTARQILRSFWLLVDRLNPSAFVHANIGPGASRIGNMLLEIDSQLGTITNLTLRYDPDQTPLDFALKAVANALKVTKPYFLNHPAMVRDWGEDYVIASCYNGMRLGGGIYTLVRLNLKKAAESCAGDAQYFLDQTLPAIGKSWLEIIESRSKFIIEDIRWFKDNFWIEEGYLQKKNFSAYAGIYGLAEAVGHFMPASPDGKAKYGWDENANQLAKRFTDRIHTILEDHPIACCEGTDAKACYHAQVGISSDVGTTPAVRVPSGQEPELYQHILAEAVNHEWISGGVSTILEFDQTAAQNPAAVLDIIRGAHKAGIRNLSIGSANSEFVRVTGYLIRRADLEAHKAEKALRHSSASLGSGFMENSPNHLHRITRKV